MPEQTKRRLVGTHGFVLHGGVWHHLRTVADDGLSFLPFQEEEKRLGRGLYAGIGQKDVDRAYQRIVARVNAILVGFPANLILTVFATDLQHFHIEGVKIIDDSVAFPFQPVGPHNADDVGIVPDGIEYGQVVALGIKVSAHLSAVEQGVAHIAHGA